MSKLAVASDEDMIGRVMGVFLLITSISMFISRLMSGLMVSSLGALLTFRTAGCVFLVLSVVYKVISAAVLKGCSERLNNRSEVIDDT